MIQENKNKNLKKIKVFKKKESDQISTKYNLHKKSIFHLDKFYDKNFNYLAIKKKRRFLLNLGRPQKVKITLLPRVNGVIKRYFFTLYQKRKIFRFLLKGILSKSNFTIRRTKFLFSTRYPYKGRTLKSYHRNKFTYFYDFKVFFLKWRIKKTKNTKLVIKKIKSLSHQLFQLPVRKKKRSYKVKSFATFAYFTKRRLYKRLIRTIKKDYLGALISKIYKKDSLLKRVPKIVKLTNIFYKQRALRLKYRNALINKSWWRRRSLVKWRSILPWKLRRHKSKPSKRTSVFKQKLIQNAWSWNKPWARKDRFILKEKFYDTSNSILNKLIGVLTKQGKKYYALKVHRKVRYLLKTSHQIGNPETYLCKVLSSIAPLVGLRRYTRGGRIYEVPVPITKNHSMSLACHWIQAAILLTYKNRPLSLEEKLVAELILLSNKKGVAYTSFVKYNLLVKTNRIYLRFLRRKRKEKTRKKYIPYWMRRQTIEKKHLIAFSKLRSAKNSSVIKKDSTEKREKKPVKYRKNFFEE